MFTDRIEGKWIDCFAEAFALCGVAESDEAVILSETQSREILVHLSELALLRLGARPVHVTLVTPRQTAPVPIRSTGSSNAVQFHGPALAALSFGGLVIDCTIEGLLHAPELPQILKSGSRVMMVSNEHPDILERLGSDPGLKDRVKAGMKRMRGAKRMRVTSAAGTDLTVDMQGAVVGGGWGFTTTPGTITNWPGGLCLCFPAAGTVNGRIVVAPGDQNLTFKRFMENPIGLTFEDDFITGIEGDHFDAQLLRDYIAVWEDRNAYAISHLGWGMNEGAKWNAMALYDKRDQNGTEQRAYGGNFLFSTGANEIAKRFTLGHFDLPLRNCTIALDGETVVENGQLCEALR